MTSCNLTTCRYNENDLKDKLLTEIMEKHYKEFGLNKENRHIFRDVVEKYGDMTYRHFVRIIVLELTRSDIMADLKKIELDIIEKAKAIAKEIAKGNDVYITKSASGVVIKKMTVGKV